MLKTIRKKKGVKKATRSLDWKQWKSGWPYDGISDFKYLSDRKKLFALNGNGWWFNETPDNPYADKDW
tara:strand:+ start:773 stop:976 length:204 start_codon:yes stop_codon:yes gene_type:complete